MGRNKTRKRLTPFLAKKLGFKPKPKTKHGNAEYYLNDKQLKDYYEYKGLAVDTDSETKVQ